VILSESVARRMAVDVGDRVEMLFVDDNGAILRDRFSLSGIYRTGVDAIDNALVLTDMRNVAREYDGDDMLVTGYEVWLKDRERAESVEASLNGALGELFLSEGLLAEAFAITRVYPEVFGWLATHDINALVVTVIMVVVALLNMITALLIIVLERQRMIGELRALGMQRISIIKLFLYRAMFIMCRGIAWGTILGIILVIIQYIWAPMPLPNEGYILTHVPVVMCWGWWLVAVIATVAVSAVVMVIPALFATKSAPAEALRYE
jgi:lipoprotein-releasing system permease protein